MPLSSDDNVVPFGGPGTDKPTRLPRSDDDELEFIRIAEINRRTILLQRRDGLTREVAFQRAAQWMQEELGTGQLSLPIESAPRAYTIYYQRSADDRAVFRELRAVVKGTLHHWPSTHEVLVDIRRSMRSCGHLSPGTQHGPG